MAGLRKLMLLSSIYHQSSINLPPCPASMIAFASAGVGQHGRFLHICTHVSHVHCVSGSCSSSIMFMFFCCTCRRERPTLRGRAARSARLNPPPCCSTGTALLPTGKQPHHAPLEHLRLHLPDGLALLSRTPGELVHNVPCTYVVIVTDKDGVDWIFEGTRH